MTLDIDTYVTCSFFVFIWAAFDEIIPGMILKVYSTIRTIPQRTNQLSNIQVDVYWTADVSLKQNFLKL